MLTKLFKIIICVVSVPATILAAGLDGIRYPDWQKHIAAVKQDSGLEILYTFDNLQGDLIKNQATSPAAADYDARNKGGRPTEGRWQKKAAMLLDDSYLFAKAYNIKDKNFTCELWVNVIAPGLKRDNRNSISGTLVGVIGHYSGWRITVSSTGNVNLAIGLKKGAISVRSEGSLVFGRWTHVAATWDGEDLKIYIDGKLQGTTVFNGDYIAVDSSKVNLRVGYAPYGIGSMKMKIGEVAIYNRALTAEEIRKNRYLVKWLAEQNNQKIKNRELQ